MRVDFLMSNKFVGWYYDIMILEHAQHSLNIFLAYQRKL